MGIFKPITNAIELKALVDEDKSNVGVTRSGDLYSFDYEKQKPQKISLEEAGEKLGLELDIVAEVAKSGGTFKVPIPIVVEKKEEVIVETDPLENQDEDHETIDENQDEVVIDVEPDPLIEKHVDEEPKEVAVVLSLKEVEQVIEPLIEAINLLKDDLKTSKELAKSRYDEFKEFKSKIEL